MNLTEFESFSLLLQSVWSYEKDSSLPKCRLNLVDVIIFKQGIPLRWLFTSEKTGEVLKKKHENITTSQIIKSFKKRLTVKGQTKHKIPTDMQIKIAKIIYKSEHDNHLIKITHKLVDERELTNILRSRAHLQDVLAIQLYMSPWPLKGCGLFEHVFNRNEHSIILHSTYELKHPDNNENSTNLQNNESFDLIPETIITATATTPIEFPNPSDSCNNSSNRIEHKGSCHDVIKPHINRLIRAIEFFTRAIVRTLTVRFVFDTSWAPFIIGLHDVELINLLPKVLYNRVHLFSLELFNTTSTSTSKNKNNRRESDTRDSITADVDVEVDKKRAVTLHSSRKNSSALSTTMKVHPSDIPGEDKYHQILVQGTENPIATADTSHPPAPDAQPLELYLSACNQEDVDMKLTLGRPLSSSVLHYLSKGVAGGRKEKHWETVPLQSQSQSQYRSLSAISSAAATNNKIIDPNINEKDNDNANDNDNDEYNNDVAVRWTKDNGKDTNAKPKPARYMQATDSWVMHDNVKKLLMGLNDNGNENKPFAPRPRTADSTGKH
eukprot:gene13621-28921_t